MASTGVVIGIALINRFATSCGIEFINGSRPLSTKQQIQLRIKRHQRICVHNVRPVMALLNRMLPLKKQFYQLTHPQTHQGFKCNPPFAS